MKILKITPAILLIIAIYLFLQTKLINFNSIVIVFFSILIFYLIFLIYDLIKQKKDNLYFFILPLLYFLTWIPFGIDLTDEGYNASLSFWTNKTNYTDIFYYSVQGSFLLLNKWLKILNFPSVLWYRVGSAIIWSAITFISYKTFDKLFNLNAQYSNSLIIFTALALLLNKLFNFVITYNVVPYLWLSLGIYFLIHSNHKNLILSGLFFILSAFSRFSFIIILPIVPLVLLVIDKQKKIIHSVFFLIVGYFTGIVVFLLLGGEISMFFSSIKATIQSKSSIGLCILTDQTHKTSEIVKQYLKDLLTVILLSILWIPFVFVNLKKNIKKYHSITYNLLFISILYIILKKTPFSDFLIILSVIMSFVLETFIILWKKKNWNLILLFLFLLFNSLIGFLGTNTGIKAVLFNGSMFIIMPFIFGVNLKNKLKNWIFSFGLFLIVFLFYGKTNYVYRDYTYSKLNTAFEIKPLRGIFSTEKKVKTIEKTYHLIQRQQIDNKYICINKPLLFYFISSKKPYSICWSVDNDSLKKYTPKYIIFSLRSLRNYNWDTQVDTSSNIDKKRIMNIHNYVEKNYSIIQNIDSIFTLYQKK